MATKKKVEEVVEEPAATVSPVSGTVTAHNTEPDKNGASITVVEGSVMVEDNTAITITAAGHAYNGGTTIMGAFRAFIPLTDGPIEVYANGERVA